MAVQNLEAYLGPFEAPSVMELFAKIVSGCKSFRQMSFGYIWSKLGLPTS